ncbi:hypothetical protein T484DRAFT_1809918 [Baffinella frigidus]|nr:hypothetical protein T484DRAFT_1809918 [Cryptophyta sp. CCMP2293]
MQDEAALVVMSLGARVAAAAARQSAADTKRAARRLSGEELPGVRTLAAYERRAGEVEVDMDLHEGEEDAETAKVTSRGVPAATPGSGDGSSERGGGQPMEWGDARSQGGGQLASETAVASGCFGSGAGAPTRKLRGALGLAIIEEEGASGEGEPQSRKGKRKLCANPPYSYDV